MIDLDKIDENILRELSSNGRITNIELADKVGLSPSACLRRVQEHERSGLILGYQAKLDSVKLGIGFKCFISVGLSNHTKKSQKDFEKAILKASEVVECHNVTGVFEYLLKVETKDLISYKTFHIFKSRENDCHLRYYLDTVTSALAWGWEL